MRASNKTIIHISKDRNQLSRDAATFVRDLAEKSIRDKGDFVVALSGGSTPKHFYEKMVSLYKTAIDWSRVFFFWSDERYVPLQHEDSNGGMARTYLLDPLNIPEKNIFYVPTGISPAAKAAEDYSQSIRQYFNRRDKQSPRFDLTMLGLGHDGHTASLFPKTKAVNETQKLVTENWVNHLNTWRITFTFPLINHSKNIIFLVAGEDKARVVNEILSKNNQNYPAFFVNPVDGQEYWYLDRKAGQFLKNK